MKNKSVLNIIELSFMLLVFALCAALCLRSFVWADKRSEELALRDEALIMAQNAAETLQHHRGELSELEKELGGRVHEGVWHFYGNGFALAAQPVLNTHEYLGSAEIRAEYGDDKGFLLNVCWQEVGAHE